MQDTLTDSEGGGGGMVGVISLRPNAQLHIGKEVGVLRPVKHQLTYLQLGVWSKLPKQPQIIIL